MSGAGGRPASPAPDQEARDAVARLDRLTTWPYPWWVLGTVGLGYFFAFFDITNIGLALPAITKSLQSSDSIVSLSVSSSLVGYIIGAVGNGMLSDHLGRRRALLVAYSLVAIGSVTTAISFNATWLIGWRLVCGMGIGAAIATVTTYVGELAPAPVRGRYTGWATFCAFAGVAVTPFAAAGLVPTIAWGWRITLGIPVLAALALPGLLGRLPESPRWLLAHERYDEATEVVRAAGGLDGPPLPEDGEPLAAAESLTGSAAAGPVGFRAVFGRRLRGRAALLTTIWFFFYIQNYAFAGLGTTLLVKHGYSLSESILFSIPTSVANVAGAAFTPFVSDRFERRKTIIVAALIMVVAEVGIGAIDGILAIVVGFFIVAFTTAMFDPLNYTLTAEHFPTTARNAGVAISDGVGHLGGAVAPPLVLAIFGAFGFTSAWIAMAASVLIAALLMPFTRTMVGRSLD